MEIDQVNKTDRYVSQSCAIPIARKSENV